MSDDAGSLGDAELLGVGRQLAGTYAVSVRCSICGEHSAPAMPDGVRLVVARAFAGGYRYRELGPEGLAAWSGEVQTLSPSIPASGRGQDHDERAERPCELRLAEGRHAYGSLDGRQWSCPCGSWVVGTRVTLSCPDSPLDGQIFVVTDAQLEELGRAGLVSADEILASVRVPVPDGIPE